MTITYDADRAADIVLLLADHPHTLTEVAPLAKRGAAPTLWSVTIKTDGTLRGILATEARMVELRDLLDQAIDRARTIERQTRNQGEQR